MSRLLVKIGGAQLSEAGARAELAQSVAAAHADGRELILVHGGGDQMRAVGARMGIEDRYHEGLRITDAATSELALMVLGGLVNRLLVQSLQEAGLSAVGLSGADGGTFSAQAMVAEGTNLGYVGQVGGVSPSLCSDLLTAGHIPVLATVAPPLQADATVDPHFFNINADHAAGPLAALLGCETCLFLTNVPGVLDAAGQLIPYLDPAGVEHLRAQGVIRGGMIPKVQAALMALEAHPQGQIKIAPAAGRNAVRAALQDGSGTRFGPDPAAA